MDINKKQSMIESYPSYQSTYLDHSSYFLNNLNTSLEQKSESVNYQFNLSCFKIFLHVHTLIVYRSFFSLKNKISQNYLILLLKPAWQFKLEIFIHDLLPSSSLKLNYIEVVLI